MKTDAKRRLRNRAARSFLRNLIKTYRETAAGTDPQAAEKSYRELSKRVDQAAAKKFIHKNKAARLKSRLSRLIAKPQATA
jgi:small subunit ribosomal protein S20